MKSMVFSSEPVEAGYVEKSPPRCAWYEVCPEGRCDGNGSVNCRVRERGVICNRMEGEYTRITFRNLKVCRIPCVSFLDNRIYSSRMAVPQ